MAKNDDEELASDSERLEEIAGYLRNMDRRDRLRTWGGFIKGVIALIPVLLVLWGAWYFYQHGDELLTKIAKEAAKQAAAVTKEQSGNVMEQLQQYLPQR